LHGIRSSMYEHDKLSSTKDVDMDNMKSFFVSHDELWKIKKILKQLCKMQEGNSRLPRHDEKICQMKIQTSFNNYTWSKIKAGVNSIKWTWNIRKILFYENNEWFLEDVYEFISWMIKNKIKKRRILYNITIVLRRKKIESVIFEYFYIK
jgi:hypothetical protein